MILVTLGTNDKQFTRLLKAVEGAVKRGAIQEEVLVQAGFTKYSSDCMKVVDYLDRNAFEEAIAKTSIVITHGGVGTIMSALEKKKVILGAARLNTYGEHVNDHQTQLLQSFEEEGYLIYMKDLEKIDQYLEQAKTFVPKPYQSEREKMLKLVSDWIDTH